ncbi:hypothetical protein DOY81_009163, partial [Sarcophaga bullata]
HLLNPSDSLILYCENWYALECKRLKGGQAAGQEKEFSFIEALNESYFSDVIIKSSDGFEYHVHASILRLNGFDCSMCVHATIYPIHQIHKISVTTTPSTTTCAQTTEEQLQKSFTRLNLSPIYLQPPH